MKAYKTPQYSTVNQRVARSSRAGGAGKGFNKRWSLFY